MTSLDGLTGGSPEVGDAGFADAPLDVGSVLDAPVEAASDAGSDAGRYCASLTTKPSFCDDFDDEGPFSNWSGSVIGPGASILRDRAASRSAPNSLLATSPANPASIAAYLRLDSPTTVHRVRVAYDMRVDARDALTAYAEVGYIRFGVTGGKQHAFYIRLRNDTSVATAFAAEAYLPDGGVPDYGVALSGNPQFSSWTRVAVDYDLGTSPHVSVTIDGAVAGSAALDPTLFTSDVAHVDIGIGYTGHPSSAAWQLRYDNVTVDWVP